MSNKNYKGCQNCKHYHRNYFLNTLFWVTKLFGIQQNVIISKNYNSCLRNVKNSSKELSVMLDIVLKGPFSKHWHREMQFVDIERGFDSTYTCGTEGKFWTPSNKFLKNKENLFVLIKND